MQNKDFAGIFSYEGWIDHIHFQKRKCTVKDKEHFLLSLVQYILFSSLVETESMKLW